MKLADAIAKRIREDNHLGTAWGMDGDVVLVQVSGPMGPGVGIPVVVDLNGAYISTCSDKATVTAYQALDKAGLDPNALVEAYDAAWCVENEALQSAGAMQIGPAAAAVQRLAECAAAIQAAAYLMTEWNGAK